MIATMQAEAELDKKRALAAQLDEAREKAQAATADALRQLTEEARTAKARAATTITEQSNQLVLLKDEAARKDAKLVEAQQAQAEALRKERELADRERELDLTVERRVTNEIGNARQQARLDADEAARLKLMERDQVIAGLQVKIEELAHKADVTSQQLQGEVQELDLERQLRTKFPFDTIEEVGKGINGADITHTVTAPSGASCGIILLESKRTKTFSAGWLPKLRDDLRAAHADIAVIATQAMPKDLSGFGSVDGVWVCEPQYAVPLIALLREGLLRVHATKQAQEGMRTKAEVVYEYLTGTQFKHRVEAIVESYTTMTADLDAEKRAITRAWAKRAAQLENTLTATAGLFGDLQAVAGAALPAPAGLELPS
jgi:hypothetical protein